MGADSITDALFVPVPSPCSPVRLDSRTRLNALEVWREAGRRLAGARNVSSG